MLRHESRLSISIVILGLTSLVTQVIMVREFLSIFYGNELVIGVLLANWMVLTGIGAYFGRYLGKGERDLLPALLVLLATVPYLTTLCLRLLRNTVFPVGSMVGIVPIIWSSFILLIPYCVLSGASFAFLAGRTAKDERPGLIGSVYALESIGSVVGGALFSLLLFHYLNTFQCLAALMAVNLATTLFVVRHRRTASIVIWGSAIVLLIPAIVMNVDLLTRRFLFPGQEILLSKDTPYGSLTVTQQAEQKNFYENGVLLASAHDATSAEESVHYAMLQRDSTRTVLMLSGAVTGAVREVLKYGVQRLDYVELNPHLIELAKQYSPDLDESRVHAFNIDPRLFVLQTPTMYDIVLLNVPEPSTVLTNRYYTLEFFERLKRRLNPGGIISLALLPSTEYQSDEAKGINSTMMKTLKAVFREVLVVPGMRTYFLGSDAKLDIRIGAKAERRGINNLYVNQYYLDDEELARRSENIQRSLLADAPLNKDFAPVSYYRQVVHWLSYYRSNVWIVALIAGLILALAAVQMNAVSVGVFAGGFAASSIEVLLLIAFQMFYGYVYEILGLIITIFMAGLAAGAFWRVRVFPQATVGRFVLIQMVVAAYCLLLPLALFLLRGLEGLSAAIHVSIFVLTFLIAVLVGAEFSVAADLLRGHPRRIASELYGVDLIGSALGALLVTILLIPMLGIVMASVVPGALSLLTAIIAFARKGSIEASMT